MVEKGNGFFEQKKFLEALENYSGAYQLQKFNAGSDIESLALLKLQIGKCYYWLSNYKLAIERLNESLSLTQGDELRLRVLNMLAVSYLQISCFDEVLNVCNMILSLSPKDYRVFSNLGLVEYYKGNYAKSIEYYKNALKYTPQTEVDRIYNNMSLSLFEEGKKDEAIEIIKKALEITQDVNRKGEFYNAYTEFLIKMDKIAEANNILNKAYEYLSYDHGIARAQWNEARILRKLNKIELAISKYNEALKFFETHEILKEAAVLCYEVHLILESQHPKKAKEYYAQFKVLSDRIKRKEEEVSSKRSLQSFW